MLYFLLPAESFWQQTVVISLGVFYFTWGLAHHIVDRDWHWKIVVEYLLIAVLGTVLLLSITARR
jgi:hypothetical protein